MVRCRFAPAPSGSLHVGNARTALFSWLHARHVGGDFVLRVEDTDASRVTEEAFRGVVEDMRWLGLDWDEGPDVGGPHGPYRQSGRLGIYREMTQRLLEDGHAYRCWCTPEELDERRRAALARGEPPGYDGRCRARPAEEIAAFEAEGRPFAIRFLMPQREWTVQDLVKGEVRWGPSDLHDFVIVRSDGSPVFLLAVAVDDMLMDITHVVRGGLEVALGRLRDQLPRLLVRFDVVGEEEPQERRRFGQPLHPLPHDRHRAPEELGVDREPALREERQAPHGQLVVVERLDQVVVHPLELLHIEDRGVVRDVTELERLHELVP